MSEEDRLARAVELVKAGNYAEAQKIVAEVIRADRNNVRAWILMAKVVDDPQKALQCWQEVARLKPDDPRVREEIAKLKGEPIPQAQPPERPLSVTPFQPPSAPAIQSVNTGLVQPTTPAGQTHSRLGIASLVIPLIMMVALCLGTVAIALMAKNLDPQAAMQDPAKGMEFIVETFRTMEYFAYWLIACQVGLPALSLIGLVLGIVGLFQKDKRKTFAILGTILNGLLLCGCGTPLLLWLSSPPGSVPVTTPMPLSTPEAVIEVPTMPSLEEAHEIGDVVKGDGYTVRLNSIEYQGGNLIADFTFENHGFSNLQLDSFGSFSAKNQDGTVLNQEIFGSECGFVRSILPGDRFRADICWLEASPDTGNVIYYDTNPRDPGIMTWNAVPGTAETADSALTLQAPMSHVGEVVQAQTHTIRLNNLEYRGTILFADFTVENQGDSVVVVDALNEFAAKRINGTLLEEAPFACGESNVSGVHGQLLPGDRYRGYFCWEGANPEDGIRLYYEPDRFGVGEGTVVWEALAENAEPVDMPDARPKADVFKIGDSVRIKDFTIILNSIEYLGSTVRATFTVENRGTGALDVDDLVVFDRFGARRRDGMLLAQQHTNDCWTTLGGEVAPGEKASGDICWAEASPADGVKIYYGASELVNEGIAVWIVE